MQHLVFPCGQWGEDAASVEFPHATGMAKKKKKKKKKKETQKENSARSNKKGKRYDLQDTQKQI